MDEEAPHVHFVLAPWHEKFSASRGRQQLLQPSSNPLIANYELAQDVVAEFFADLGILRGERRAKAIRQAKAAALPLPSQPVHMPPADWRRQQALDLAQARKKVEAEKAVVIARKAQVAALERGLKAIARREIVYVSGTEDHPEQLVQGEAFPQDRASRAGLERVLRMSLPDVMRHARALSDAAQTLLNKERTGLEQEKDTLAEARRNLQEQEEQILIARLKVTRRAQEIALDLQSIAGMRETLGLDSHPEFDALIARYRQAGSSGGRRNAALQ